MTTLQAAQSTELPLFQQLVLVLRIRILNGLYAPGTAIPSEAALCDEFGLSRTTVRQAVGVLVGEGLIVRQRGYRSIVSPDLVPTEPAFSGYLEDLVTFSLATEMADVEIATVVPPKAVGRFFDMDEGRTVRIQRVRYAHGEPLAFSVSFVPADLVASGSLGAREFGGTLDYLTHLGIDVPRADQTIEADLADALTANKLLITPGKPVLRVEIRYFDQADRAVALTRMGFRGDRYRYLVRLTRLSTIRWRSARRTPNRPNGPTT